MEGCDNPRCALALQNPVIGGDFRILQPLASGGMGSVYIAEQLSTGQQRALKLMHPNLVANSRLRDRFEQEARIGGRVPSEHVVQVIGAGVDAALGVPWLAMELLSGEDLAAALARRGPIPFAELVPIYRQLCHALGAAHSVGIVHRDVKPENVFLASLQSAASSWEVKVLDFGIAKLHADAQSGATGQVGTPLWMAPEQADSRRPVTPAADVWALGLVAFRLLVGRYYWRTAEEPASGLPALFRETFVDPLVPASERSCECGIPHALPAGFDAWFAGCVAREPERRFANAHEALAALEALGHGAAQPTPPPVGQSSHAAGLGMSSGGVHAHATSMPTLGSLPAQQKRSSLTLLLAVLGGGLLLLLLVLGVGGLGAGAYFFHSSSPALGAVPSDKGAPVAAPTQQEPSPVSSADSPGTDPAAKRRKGPTPNGPSAPGPSPDTPAPASPTTTTTATTTATSPPAQDNQAKPIDKAAAQQKVSAAAAAAGGSCANSKTPGAQQETYTGTRGFRPGGSGSTFMTGVGGARACVFGAMDKVFYGKYAHAEEWHVESFPFSVTVK